jgi:hypothetical protein
MEPVYCSYSVLPKSKQRKGSRKSCKKTNKKSKNSSRCELICNRCGLKQNREQRLMRREALYGNQQYQNPFSESYSSPLQKRSRKTLDRKPVASVITKDSSSKLSFSEKSQLNEKGVSDSIIDIYPVEYWREFLRPKSIEELQKRERLRKQQNEVVSYVDSSTPLLSDISNDERQAFIEETSVVNTPFNNLPKEITRDLTHEEKEQLERTRISEEQTRMARGPY